LKEHASELQKDVSLQLREVLEQRNLSIVFQPIFSFADAGYLGYEALVRGPEGSLVHNPLELFNAAAEQGLVVELNVVCIQEVLRTYAGKDLPGNLFLNVSPQLILQRGFSQERSGKFMKQIGLDPSRVVIELTEDYPTFDFRLVRESLQLYRSMGFRIAIDDLGEGFASLRLWSELKPEFVKADKHFVAGIARDPVKVQFLRAIQHIAENCGSLVIAEGIENAEDFRVAKDIGIACVQGWFLGRPEEDPARTPSADVKRANADARLPVVPMPRMQARSEACAQDFLRSVDAVAPQASLGLLLDRFAASPQLAAIPVLGAPGIQGVVSRSWLDALGAFPDTEKVRAKPCIEFIDPVPIRVEADLDIAALTAILVESDARRLADGFVIAARGRYLGMGRSQDVMRSLQQSKVLAARYTSPLTLLPGQVPINEHLERLLKQQVPFSTWFVEVDPMRGLNDGEGFKKGDALIASTARMLEGVCEPGIDFVGHVAGSRFVVLMQSGDWRARADRAVAEFPALVREQIAPEVQARGYFIARLRDGREDVRPLPKLAIGILPVLPGLFETRHEVVALAKQANQQALALATSGVQVDEQHANAYPQSVLFDGDAP
jgi:EAL domain-containing protein (putative c-di-GMP-specific phosphodiesterase class I)/GGDEF domain-containing protein